MYMYMYIHIHMYIYIHAYTHPAFLNYMSIYLSNMYLYLPTCIYVDIRFHPDSFSSATATHRVHPFRPHWV